MEPLIKHLKNQVSIPDNELEVILQKFEQKQFRKKEHLLQYGNLARYEFFVIQGCARVYITDYNGVEHNSFFPVENWWAGDLKSFINNSPATFSIQALEDMTVLAITSKNWKILIEEVPSFLKYSHALFLNSVIGQQDRIVQSLSFTAKERYEFFIHQYPHLVQRITQKHIASYLGITPEFLSILRNRRTK
ncbi:Crp/Fnr family transcriptional regulator [Aureispira sp. CCB-QB1]|uniref:Crp/Fnr family transcriptional regulator n=1 Tax=Aureispira sp. CCB-QB1 TaxID=1313421 RepID=UPI0006979C3F|nr:Crp/Fnr family transcriptional regulator [Aureispira sp. CCB-QB1]